MILDFSFTLECVKIKNKHYIKGVGSSKKEAEQNAALNFLESNENK